MRSVDEQDLDKLMLGTVSKDRFLELIKVKSENLGDELSEMLNYAYKQHSDVNVETALYLVFTYELFSENYIDVLNNIILCDWHEQHENIAMLVQRLKSPKSVYYLYVSINQKYSYLEYDDSYALAVKCIWALGDIGNEEAKEYLMKLLNSENEIIVENAKKQLERKN